MSFSLESMHFPSHVVNFRSRSFEVGAEFNSKFKSYNFTCRRQGSEERRRWIRGANQEEHERDVRQEALQRKER